jgi:hypothetical protein
MSSARHLTEQGRDTILAIDKSWKRLEKEALAGLDEKDVKKLRKLLRQIERNLSAHAGAVDEPAEEEAEIPAPSVETPLAAT